MTLDTSDNTYGSAAVDSTFKFGDLHASTLYEGYLPGHSTYNNPGSFVDLSTLDPNSPEYQKAYQSQQDNVVGLFQRKGLTKEQAMSTPEFQAIMNQAAQGDTKGAFQAAALSVPKGLAVMTNNTWGAGVEEGGQANLGKSFLEGVVNGDYDDDIAQIHKPAEGQLLARAGLVLANGRWRKDQTYAVTKLYESGLGNIDPEGIKHWVDEIHNENMTLKEVAQAMLDSPQAALQDKYHAHFNRNIGQEGLDYFLDTHKEDPSGQFEHIVTYRGEDQDGDGIITPEERLTSQYQVTAETLVRDDFQNIMGQVSNQANQDAMFADTGGLYTAPNNARVQELAQRIRDSRDPSLVDAGGQRLNWDAETETGTPDASFDQSLAVNTQIGYEGMAATAISQGDVDDFGPEGTPTNMGRFATTEEIADLVTTHGGDLEREKINDFGQTVFNNVRDKTWDTLTDENVKEPDDFTPPSNPFGNQIAPPPDDGTGGGTGSGTGGGNPVPMTIEEVTSLVDPSNLDWWKENSNIWKPRFNQQQQQQDGGVDRKPTIDKPDPYQPLDVNKQNVNYMPGFRDQRSVRADWNTDQAYKAGMGAIESAESVDRTPKTAQGQVGQRFTGTSAKGVRMKRSKASRMGTIRGTKQLGREQQTQSLNI